MCNQNWILFNQTRKHSRESLEDPLHILSPVNSKQVKQILTATPSHKNEDTWIY